MIPSSGKISLSIHAELPPLATDAYLRTHLKVEAFYVPLRLCYGGFQSFFSGEQVYRGQARQFTRIDTLPFAFVPDSFYVHGDQEDIMVSVQDLWNLFGPSTLTDYFDVKFTKLSDGSMIVGSESVQGSQTVETLNGLKLNLFPYLCYHLIYDHFYRNKSVQLPCFCPPVVDDRSALLDSLGELPYSSYYRQVSVVPDVATASGDSLYSDYLAGDTNVNLIDSRLKDGTSVFSLRQRNYGDDYFTAAKPRATEGVPVTVQTDVNGRFTIASLRLQNALADFADVNNYATPDYQQANLARYGVNISDAIVQHPTLLGSADFPMFTKGVDITSGNEPVTPSRNPFVNEGMIGSAGGHASANGQDFVCSFDVKECGYIMVMATLVPEANYADGIAKDMRYFTQPGMLTDIPCSLLEGVGDEPIMAREVGANNNSSLVFGYVQRYLWHKIGGVHSVHGLFRKGESLEAFAPQRAVAYLSNTISSNFLKIPKTALDMVAVVNSGISNYGVMMDCSINCFVSEPLSESALPSLVDPSKEHGRSVYLKNGGSKLA